VFVATCDFSGIWLGMDFDLLCLGCLPTSTCILARCLETPVASDSFPYSVGDGMLVYAQLLLHGSARVQSRVVRTALDVQRVHMTKICHRNGYVHMFAH